MSLQKEVEKIYPIPSNLGKLEIALEKKKTCRRVAANVAWVRLWHGRGTFLFISTATTPQPIAVKSYEYEPE